MQFSQKEIKLAAKANLALKKLGWKKWEPEVGEWCIRRGRLRLITRVYENNTFRLLMKRHVLKSEVVPLLHWERIEEILEGMGYWLEVDKALNKYIKKGWMKVHARIYEDIARNAAGNGKYISCAEGKTRQVAVMRAVIELGKEINHD